MNNILKIQNLNHSINGINILKDVNLDIGAEQIIGLFGANGAGKSTMLRKISNIEASDGDIYINTIKNDFLEFRTDVCLVTSTIEIPKHMSLQAYCELLQISFNVDTDFANMYANKLGIKRYTAVSSLSKGDQEMLQLIAWLATDCELLLLDEPLSSIDIFKRDTVLEMLIESKLRGKTIIITTHLIDDVEAILDEVVYLREGTIDFVIDCEEIQSEDMSISSYLKRRCREEKW